MDEQEATAAALGSPRRRKPVIDLDAALYLQSQASYVQEPNQRISPVSKCSSLSSSQASAHLSPASSGQHQTPILPNIDHQRLNRLTIVDPININYYQIHQTARQLNFSNDNIVSVDYIDCVSNNDLQQQQQPLRANYRTMRGLTHCRKHLRFQRNRVEPEALPGGTANTSGDSSDQLAHPTSQEGNGAINNTLAKTAEATGDSSSIVTSSLITSENELQNSGRGANNVSYGINNNTNNISSVLYPISVSEVKKRTYFIGSISQDTLLGQDELYRHFPNGRVSIFVCTWNQNRKRAPMNLNDLLLPDQLVYMPDIYAIGIQEAFSSQNDYLREWEIELQTTLGPNHVLLHSCSLGVLHLALFVRRDLIWFCSTPEESVYNSRSMPTNMIKTKGAVSIAFRFFGTSFMFTNCHFPAHENKLKDRIDEYQRIINSIDLPKNLKLLKPRYLSNDSTARFDCVFFMGDLNFRLEQRTFDETIHILDDIFQQNNQKEEHILTYEALTQNDELLKVMESDQAFHGFDEGQIKFPPTYKFLAQTNKYDRQTRRVPSYTDRILFRSKRQRHIQCLIYDWLPQLLSSDHKPVYCLFDVLVRPGHEQKMISSLNAGLFQRAIYLEALKRRAEDPDSIRENGAAGSLICSIS